MAGSVQTPQADRERKFDMILNSLKSVLGHSKELSDKLYEKVNYLYGFSLKCEDATKSEKMPAIETSGTIVEIDKLINEMEFVNRRNREIIEHLDGLV